MAEIFVSGQIISANGFGDNRLSVRYQLSFGWPRLLFQVWHHDGHGRQEIAGYGTLLLPNCAGKHELTSGCWRPRGSWREELVHRLLGGGMQLTSFTALEDPSIREKIVSVSAGTIRLQLNIITKDFQRYGILP
uniref:B9 domain-containing protein 2 n=1 Tax=Caenorhabditis japonica TaxID=281687 RepID=A0A8R1HV61_CAEJA